MHPKINNQSRKTAHKPINVFRSMKLLGLTVFRDISVFFAFSYALNFLHAIKENLIYQKTQKKSTFSN